MSLSSRLLFPVFLGSYLDLLFKTYFFVSFWFFLGVCFYELGKTATSPSVAGVALCRSFPFVNCMVGVFGGAAGVGACVCSRETQGQSAPGLSWPTGWSWSGYSLQGVPGASYLGLPWQMSWGYIQLEPAQATGVLGSSLPGAMLAGWLAGAAVRRSRAVESPRGKLHRGLEL